MLGQCWKVTGTQRDTERDGEPGEGRHNLCPQTERRRRGRRNGCRISRISNRLHSIPSLFVRSLARSALARGVIAAEGISIVTAVSHAKEPLSLSAKVALKLCHLQI